MLLKISQINDLKIYKNINDQFTRFRAICCTLPAKHDP